MHFNPAFLVDTRYKLNINLLAVNAYVQNNYYNIRTPYSQWQVVRNRVDSSDLDNNGFPVFTSEMLEKNTGGKKKFAFFTAEVKGPSVMYEMKDKGSFALSTRVRATAHLADISTGALDYYLSDIDTAKGKDTASLLNKFAGAKAPKRNMDICANAFQQITASYGRVLKNENRHFLTGGISVSYLLGMGAAYLKVNKIESKFVNDDTVNISEIDLDYGITKPDYYTRQQKPGLPFFRDDPLGRGVSLDIGFNYERRIPENEYFYDMDRDRHEDRSMRKYKYRLGVSLVDLGKINYNNSRYIKRIHIKGNLNTRLVEDDLNQVMKFDNTREADSFLYHFFPDSDSSGSFKVKLPAALNFIADFNLGNNFFAGGQYTQNMRLRKAVAVRTQSVLYLNARYETRPFEISFSLLFGNYYHKMQAGLFLRSGPFFIGTDNLGGLVNTASTNAFNIYTGFSVLIPYKRLTDIDEDLVSDKLDKCPADKGGYKTEGCPDKDGDGTPDKDDECPKIVGPKRSHGCPNEDGDKLWAKADKCPDKAGDKKNDGCPDTDGDGLFDHKDKCPTIAGNKANGGCPVKEEVKKTEPPKKPVKPVKKEEEPMDFNKYYYYPVVGAFGVKTNAENFSKSFTTKTNVKTSLVYNEEKKIYYVSTGKLSTKEDAVKIIDNLNQPEINSLINGNMWMYAVAK